ncbi:hypothetical protein JZY91_08010 [Corynebacterium sp. CNCTC7651]|uniref:hypothetical protein n=1 Tax=Corynebacterium sp. CNCTC7651 TaxID=2815361 RepID=UPI001F4002AB|nr:hypothetical protein [Corynebacterium sp. CNCTC7651]UIZ91676.1 hypothetical protein JZY91_08010 [Corynebacterium sp. CNCTC7651]
MRPSLRKAAAATAALIVSSSLAFAAPAQAQERNMANLMKVATQADTIACKDLKSHLNRTGRVNSNTTRGDLVAMANAELASTPLLRMAARPTINKVADRALACKLVKSGGPSKNGQGKAPSQPSKAPAKPGPSQPGKAPAKPGPSQPGKAQPKPAQPAQEESGSSLSSNSFSSLSSSRGSSS